MALSPTEEGTSKKSFKSKITSTAPAHLETQSVAVDLNSQMEKFAQSTDNHGALKLQAKFDKSSVSGVQLSSNQRRGIVDDLIKNEQYYEILLPDNVGMVKIRLREDQRIPSDADAPYRMVVKLNPEAYSDNAGFKPSISGPSRTT